MRMGLMRMRLVRMRLMRKMTRLRSCHSDIPSRQAAIIAELQEFVGGLRV